MKPLVLTWKQFDHRGSRHWLRYGHSGEPVGEVNDRGNGWLAEHRKYGVLGRFSSCRAAKLAVRRAERKSIGGAR